MSCIIESTYRISPNSIPLIVYIDTSMATHISPTQGVVGSDLVSLQQLRAHENHPHRTFHRIQQPLLTRITPADTLIFDRLTALASSAGRVHFLSCPFLSHFNTLDLSRSLELLKLEGQEPCDNDESPGRNTSRDRDRDPTNNVNDRTDYPSNRDLPPSANTRSRHRRGSDGGGSPRREKRAESRSFDPYGPPRSTLDINKTIQNILLRPHANAGEGYVYAFQHPDDIALAQPPQPAAQPHLIKIGRSKNHRARMRQTSKRCGYVPRTVFAYLMPRHAMVERVVHAQLHNSRLRDVGCVGCGTRHEEWFRVDVRRAEHVVALWKAFVECSPYDEQGAMLPAWRERLEQLDLGDADCWQRFVHGDLLGRQVAGLPQELEADTAPAGVIASHIYPSSDGDRDRDEQEGWETPVV